MKFARGDRPPISLFVLLIVLGVLEAAVPFHFSESFRNNQAEDTVEDTVDDNMAEDNVAEDNGRAIDNFRDNFNQDAFKDKETRQGREKQRKKNKTDCHFRTLYPVYCTLYSSNTHCLIGVPVHRR